MKIVISNEGSPGEWDVEVVPQRRSEADITRLKIATILFGIAYDWLKEEVVAEPAPPPVEEKPQIMLPGRDFPTGGLPKGV
jgi:hypothetical protein